jgi:DNA polymerase-3 subunit delta'
MNPPGRLQDIVGNRQLVSLLRKGELPQSSLFSGPNGVGKKTVALLLAALANCRNPADYDLCGRCGSCIKAEAGNHPDILLFDAEQQKISIESMRRLSREAQYRPFEGNIRFFIIDEAERMSEEAANSILKTLEEPPETSKLVLVSAYPQRLLPTILSRCQVFPFQGLSNEEILDYLRKKTDLMEEELRASLSEGSLGSAIELDIEETIAKRDRMLRFLETFLQTATFECVFQLCESHPLRSELKKRDQVSRYLELLEVVCYDVYFLIISAKERIVNRDCLESIRVLSRSVSLEQIRDLLYHIAEAQRDVDRYVNPLMCFETLWLGWQRMELKDASDRYSQVSNRQAKR